MNRMYKILGICVLAVLFVFSCSDDELDNRNKPEGTILNSIVINTSNAKTEYKVHDDFDPSGLVVTARYTDGTSHVVNEEDYEVRSNNYNNSRAGTYIIRVFYLNKNNTYNVNVTEYHPYDKDGYLNLITEIKRTQTELLGNFHNIYHPFVLKEQLPGNAGYPYTMWLMGWSVADSNPGYPGSDAVFLARGSDLYTWEVYSGNVGGNAVWDDTMDPTKWVPVIVANEDPEKVWFDAWHVGDASVVKKGGVFYMMLSATGFGLDRIHPWDRDNDTDGDIICVMGATSTDGINWVKSAEPTLLYEREKYEMSTQETNPPTLPSNFYGWYHRPSLMYDESIDKWRMWFDYWVNGRGMHLGYAEATVANDIDIMDASSWNILSKDNDPQYPIEITNPDVIKVGNKYFLATDPAPRSHGANPALVPSAGFDRRQLMIFASHNGYEWRPAGWIQSDSNTPALQVPTLYYENDVLYIFYGTLGSATDPRQKSIRVIEVERKVFEKW